MKAGACNGTAFHGYVPLLFFLVVFASQADGVGIGRTGAVKERGKKLIIQSSEKIAAMETITAPNVPSGVANGVLGTSYTYSTGGSTSNLGHTVEYRFNWGDGTYSAWSTGTSASHSWTVAGTYSVSAEARCQTHASVTAVSTSVGIAIDESVSAPSTPSGPAGGTAGTSYTYTTGSSTSSLGHAVEYRFDWGDGIYSAWGSGTSASHSWTAVGAYAVQAQARCAMHTSVTAISTALSVGIDTAPMILIPTGTFNMGDSLYALPIHSVHLDAFYIDKYEVTFDQYDAFCTATSRATASDSGWGRGTRPVINVTWYDAEAYCAWAGKRLPTEAEWERACRAGTNTAWSFGDDAGPLGTYAWYLTNSSNMTHPVGEKAANPLGLYDMHGNVWEWCSDWYDSGYYAVSPSNNPPGPASGTNRISRGGSWHDDGAGVRSGNRNYSGAPGSSYPEIGCRCARTP